jgi:hypothetical protein
MQLDIYYQFQVSIIDLKNIFTHNVPINVTLYCFNKVEK